MKASSSVYTRDIWLYVYYGILMLILISWRSIESAPPMPYRLTFVALLMVPVFFKRSIMPAILTCFVSIALYGYAYSYMPTMLYLYVGLVSFMSLITVEKTHFNIPLGVLVLTLFVTFVNLVATGTIEDISYSFFIFLLFFLSVGRQDKFFFNRMSSAYIVITLILSIFFLTSFELFAVSYGDIGEDLERGGWTDPNYFGTVVGMGTVIAVIQLSNRKGLHYLTRLLYVAVIAVSMVTLVINASRGAIVSVVGALSVMLLFSKTRFLYKLLALAIGGIFLAFIYNSGFMDLLIYRSMDATVSSAGGRIGIWTSKLNSFVSGNFINIFFGYGTEGGYTLTGRNIGFHNDFVAALVQFGFIGLILYLVVVFAPIYYVFKCKSPARISVYVLSAYLFLCSMSLEPITSGRLPFVMLLFTIHILAKQGKDFNYQ